MQTNSLYQHLTNPNKATSISKLNLNKVTFSNLRLNKVSPIRFTPTPCPRTNNLQYHMRSHTTTLGPTILPSQARLQKLVTCFQPMPPAYAHQRALQLLQVSNNQL